MIERRLCDDDGMVSDTLLDPPDPVYPGLTYLKQLNNLRSHTAFARGEWSEPITEAFHCTGGAHLAGMAFRCTSSAHRNHEQRIVISE